MIVNIPLNQQEWWMNWGKGFNRIFDFYAVVAALCTILMIALIFFNAVLRYVFDTSYYESEELARIAFLWSIFLGMTIVFKEKKHIAVTLVKDRLGPQHQKVLSLVNGVINAAVLIFLVIGGVGYISTTLIYTTGALKLNYAVISSTVVVMGATALLVVFRDFVVDFLALLKLKRDQT